MYTPLGVHSNDKQTFEIRKIKLTQFGVQPSNRPLEIELAWCDPFLKHGGEFVEPEETATEILGLQPIGAIKAVNREKEVTLEKPMECPKGKMLIAIGDPAVQPFLYGDYKKLRARG